MAIPRLSFPGLKLTQDLMKGICRKKVHSNKITKKQT